MRQKVKSTNSWSRGERKPWDVAIYRILIVYMGEWAHPSH